MPRLYGGTLRFCGAAHRQIHLLAAPGGSGMVVRSARWCWPGLFVSCGRGAAPGAIQHPSNNSRRARLDCREEHPGGIRRTRAGSGCPWRSRSAPTISLTYRSHYHINYISNINYIALDRTACPVRSQLGRQGVVMFTNKAKVLLFLTQDVLDRAQVLRGGDDRAQAPA